MTETRLKRVARLTSGGTPSVDDPQYWEEDGDGTPWVSIGDMSDGASVTATGRQVSQAGIKNKRLPIGPPGTLLFAMYASVGAVAELGVAASWNQALLGIEPLPDLATRRFIRYWLEHLRPTLGALTRSNTQDNLNADQVGNFPFSTLSSAEQQTIADYLDGETARIDALITKKRRMIDLLDLRWKDSAQRQLLAHSSQRVPMRRLLSRPPQYGASLSGSPTLPEGGVRYLRITDLDSDGALRTEDPRYLTPAEAHRFLLDPGDLLFARSGATSGKAFRYSEGSDSKAAFAGYLIRMTFDQTMILPELVEAWTQTEDYWGQIREAAVQSTIENVSAERYKELLVPVPPTDSQLELAHRLSAQRTHSSHLQSKLDEQIDLLTERRQALITAAVTGELEIPGVSA